MYVARPAQQRATTSVGIVDLLDRLLDLLDRAHGKLACKAGASA